MAECCSTAVLATARSEDSRSSAASPFLTLTARGAAIETVRDGRRQVDRETYRSPVPMIREQRVTTDELAGHFSHLPFQSGAAIGFLSYELSRFIEPFPRRAKDDTRLPRTPLFLLRCPAGTRPQQKPDLDHCQKPSTSPKTAAGHSGPNPANRLDGLPTTPLRPTGAPFLGKQLDIRRLLGGSEAGQVLHCRGGYLSGHLSQCLRARCSLAAPHLYQRLRLTGASPFGAYLREKVGRCSAFPRAVPALLARATAASNPTYQGNPAQGRLARRGP